MKWQYFQREKAKVSMCGGGRYQELKDFSDMAEKSGIPLATVAEFMAKTDAVELAVKLEAVRPSV